MAAATLAVTGCLSVPSYAQVPDPVVSALQARAEAHGFDGLILVGGRDGAFAQFTTSPDLSVGDTWRWASITKQLAAVLVMQEVAQGRIDLDAPVSRYWPGWKAPHAATIRIRDLLMHRSGLPQPDDSAADSDGLPRFYGRGATTPAAGAGGFCAGLPRAAPPAEFEYNNCDTIVLGEILRRITGRSFDKLLRDRISRPLMMRSVGMFKLGRVAKAHVRPTGEFSDKDRLINLGVYGAAGGAYGTIADLWRFDHALLSGRLLRTAAREQMWEASRSNGFYGFSQWIYPAKLKGCETPVRIVERQGLIGGIELRNYLLPETGQALILFSRRRPTNLGDPWEGRGFAFDLLSVVACSPRGV